MRCFRRVCGRNCSIIAARAYPPHPNPSVGLATPTPLLHPNGKRPSARPRQLLDGVVAQPKSKHRDSSQRALCTVQPPQGAHRLSQQQHEWISRRLRAADRGMRATARTWRYPFSASLGHPRSLCLHRQPLQWESAAPAAQPAFSARIIWANVAGGRRRQAQGQGARGKGCRQTRQFRDVHSPVAPQRSLHRRTLALTSSESFDSSQPSGLRTWGMSANMAVGPVNGGCHPFRLQTRQRGQSAEQILHEHATTKIKSYG